MSLLVALDIVRTVWEVVMLVVTIVVWVILLRRLDKLGSHLQRALDVIEEMLIKKE